MKTVLRLIPIALLMPLLTFAQVANPGNAGNFGGVKNFFAQLTNFMNSTLVPAIFALAFLVFIWGMFKTFILGGHDEEKVSEGKQLMMYAILGFVIMISLWGIVTIIAESLGLAGGISNRLIPFGPGPR